MRSDAAAIITIIIINIRQFSPRSRGDSEKTLPTANQPTSLRSSSDPVSSTSPHGAAKRKEKTGRGQQRNLFGKRSLAYKTASEQAISKSRGLPKASKSGTGSDGVNSNDSLSRAGPGGVYSLLARPPSTARSFFHVQHPCRVRDCVLLMLDACKFTTARRVTTDEWCLPSYARHTTCDVHVRVCVCVCATITLLLLMVICGWILRVIAFIQSRTRDIRLFLIAGFIDRESLHLASVGDGGGRTPLEQAEQQ